MSDTEEMTDASYLTPRPTPGQVTGFCNLVRAATGVELSDQEAWERATELVSLFRMFVGPLPEDEEGTDVQTSSGLPV